MDKLNSSWISQTVLSWLASDGRVFLPEASTWLYHLAIIMTILLACRWTLEALSGGSYVSVFANAGAFFCRLILATFLLHFYAVSMPFGGVSFSGLLPNTGMQLASMVDQSATASVFDAMAQIELGTKLSIFKSLPELSYDYGLTLSTLIMRGLMFLLSSAGFIAIGIGAAVGPLSIPFLIVPRLSWIFWNWLSFMISASMFQVVASILGALWSHILLVVFQHLFHGDYSAIDAAKLLPAFVALNLAMAFTVLGVGAMTAALYGGAAHSFDSFGRTITAATKAIL